MCFGWTPNRGIYGNDDLHESYLKTKGFILKKKVPFKRLRRLLCSELIKLHFNFACTVWYPSLNKKHKNNLQVLQNKYMRFCLQLDNKEHIRTEHFDKVNWFPIDQWFKQRYSTSVFDSSLTCVLNILMKFTKQPIKAILLLEILLWNSLNH